jgi:acyl-CoA thioesterase
VSSDPVAAMFGPASLATLLGITAVDVGPGHATCELLLRPQHDNQAGVTHGGAIFTLADTAVGLASARPGGPAPLGTAFALQLVRACRAGDVLRAQAVEEHRGRTLASQRVVVTRVRDGALVASLSAQLMLREVQAGPRTQGDSAPAAAAPPTTAPGR